MLHAQPPQPLEVCLPDQLGGKPRDFYEHPLLMMGGIDRWSHVTNAECDVPYYYASNDQASRLRYSIHSRDEENLIVPHLVFLISNGTVKIEDDLGAFRTNHCTMQLTTWALSAQDIFSGTKSRPMKGLPIVKELDAYWMLHSRIGYTCFSGATHTA